MKFMEAIMQTVCIWRNREELRRAADRVENDIRDFKRKEKIRAVAAYIIAGCSFFCSGLLVMNAVLTAKTQTAVSLAAILVCAVCLILCGVYCMLHRKKTPERVPGWYMRYLTDEQVFQYVQEGKPIMFSQAADDRGNYVAEREADYALIDFDRRQVYAIAETENGELYFGSVDLEDLHLNWQPDERRGNQNHD